MIEIRSARRAHRTRREPEPDGLGEAVAAGAFMLALMTGIAAVGFAWEKTRERSAHDVASELVRRLSLDGREALLPPWSGLGAGPKASTAQNTFDAVRRLGTFVAHRPGRCVLASRFDVCSGTRYRCQVAGETPAGPLNAAIGICQGGRSAKWTFDSMDLAIPFSDGDTGNRAGVEAERDGLIRYGTTPISPEPITPRSRRRGFAPPFVR